MKVPSAKVDIIPAIGPLNTATITNARFVPVCCNNGSDRNPNAEIKIQMVMAQKIFIISEC